MKTTMRKGEDAELFDRLIAVIEASGRDYKDISLAAGLGQNYVQQMIRNRKAPAVTNFMSIMNELGRHNAIYVLMGRKASPEDDRLLELLGSLSQESKDKAVDFFRSLLASQGRQ